MKGSLLLLSIALCCAFAQVVEFADCELRPVAGSGVTGFVRFTRQSSASTVDVSVNINGIPSGTPEVAIHVHTWGDVSDVNAGAAAGGHFVGAGATTHGCPPSTQRHEGDMGNWTVTSGSIVQTKALDILALTGANSIIGRAVIVHQRGDDCTTQPTGNAGGRLAQCVIGIGNMTTISQTGTNSASVAPGSTPISLAVCDLTSSTTSLSSPHGSVYFVRESNGVRIIGQFTGINGTHGLHVHNFGDLSLASFVSAGSHWNPNNAQHDMPPRPRHAGDLGNVQTFDSNGVGWYDYVNPEYSSIEPLLGRAVILHASFDHGAGEGCDQAGTSGPRMMSCVIGVGNSTAPAIPTPPAVDNNWPNVACSTSSPDHKKKKDRTGLIVALSVGGGLVLIALVALVVFVKFVWKPGKRPYQSL